MFILKSRIFSFYIYVYRYIYIFYIVHMFFFVLCISSAGTGHTLGTEACHTCIAVCILQLVSWRAECRPGSAAVGKRDLHVCTNSQPHKRACARPVVLSVRITPMHTHTQPYIMSNLTPLAAEAASH